MGDYLKKEFGDRCTTFGFAIYKGTFSANDKQGIGTYALQEAPKNSLEYRLNSFGKNLLFFPHFVDTMLVDVFYIFESIIIFHFPSNFFSQTRIYFPS